MPEMIEKIQKRKAAGQPTEHDAILEDHVSQLQGDLNRALQKIRVLEAKSERLGAMLAAHREERKWAEHQIDVLQGNHETLVRQTFEGTVSMVTDSEVEIAVDNAAASEILRIAKDRFVTEVFIGDRVKIDTFCSLVKRVPQTGSTDNSEAARERLGAVVEELRRRSAHGPVRL